jgi:CO dehydrogenase maturation factor
MTKMIALAGKGGTGKTTVAALLIQRLVERVRGPLLAIDADPASNLHMALGMSMPATVGQIREEMSKSIAGGQIGGGMSRPEYLDMEVRMSLEEGKKIDLIAMGRPEGPGCYCAFNHMLRQVMDNISRTYQIVVVDNEAGMEHISRRTTRDVDLLLLITDPTIRGVHTAAEMVELAAEVEVNVKETMLIVNRVSGELPEPLQEAIEDLGLEVAAYIPTDENINRLDALGTPLIQLNGDSPAAKGVEELADRILTML